MRDEETTASYRQQAREIVHSIAEQIEDDELREGFLGRAVVFID